MFNQPRVPVRAALLMVVAVILTACNLQAPTPDQATATSFAFPTATEPASTGSISGRLWHDSCQAAPEAEAAPAGCVAAESGGYQADGILAADETGIAGATVRLGEGSCPAFGLATALTGADGSYQFDGLAAGTYCVSIDASSPENSNVMLPGGWTFPAASSSGPTGQQAITLADAAVIDGVNFGWEFDTNEATATPEATSTEPSEATATITPTASATLDPADPKAGLGSPIFEDTFQSGANWSLYSNDNVEFTLGDGRLEMKALEADYTDWWTLAGPSVEDFYVEAQGGLEACAGRDEFGLVVRSTNQGGDWVGYLFAVTCDGRYALRIWDGEAVIKVIDLTPSPEITAGPNQEHTIGLRAEGTTFTLYINGQQVAQATDSTYDEGLTGVFIGAGNTPGVEGHINEIAVYGLP